MTTITVGTHGAARRNLNRALVERIPFRTSGALRGEVETYTYQGDGTFLEVDYVVYSYAMPIAWHDAMGWHQDRTRVSVTTSKHQSIIGGTLAIEGLI